MKKEDLASFDHDKFLLVDIREDDEVRMLPSIAQAVHIPMSQLPAALAAGQIPHDKTIVTICMSGGRCHTANAWLEQNGFHTDLLEGGMVEL